MELTAQVRHTFVSCDICFTFAFHMQILMNVRLALTTVIQMLHALTLRVALSVCVIQGSQEME